MFSSLSENFTWDEAEITTHREFDNTIPPELESIIRNTAYGMERIRFILKTPVIISSWYRSPEINVAVGSSKTSQHIKGEAVDFISPKFGRPVSVAKKLVDEKKYIKFDQLILEHTWLHVSFSGDPNRPQRGEVLSLLKNKKYTFGLTDSNGNPYYG